METMQELIPLAKEAMAQKPRGKLLRLYVLGSVLALFGVVLGLMDTLCSTFTAPSRVSQEQAAELRDTRQGQAPRTQAQLDQGKAREAALLSRTLSLRLHAS